MLQIVEKLMREHIESLGDLKTSELFQKVPKGKRLRAKLILKIAGLENPQTQNLASIIELIHAASLLHDDVIDDATLRRGKPSLNAEFDNKTAIMMGDILYSKGFSELTSFSKDISFCISNAVALLSVGELLDVELSKAFNPSFEKYFDMIYKKTASLIEASASSAAMLAGKQSEKYALYGKNLGLAFQIIDDILDVTQTEEVLGKPSLNDFKEGKATLPYLYMYEKLNPQDKSYLMTLYKKELSAQESVWIKAKMAETGAIERCMKDARELGNEALLAIKYEEDVGLVKIITEMIERNF
ncbi:MAG: polyprenyl synthetase family protein [Sulfurospirillaceae bacterium]|nr:polyprenyl synthetase family protein [Sulfurospirillaceae bacterium]